MDGIFPVVLSGGSGTRLWPLSRAMFPKQFIRFNGDGESLLGQTLQRLKPGSTFRSPTILCNSDHRFLVKELLERQQITARAVILEPVPRNTAAAVAVGALSAMAENPDAILVVMPSDHAIKDEERFLSAVQQAAQVASSGRLVLFGITPASPHTGYGYIRRGEPLEGFSGSAFSVASFTEKPDASTAQRYLDDGG